MDNNNYISDMNHHSNEERNDKNHETAEFGNHENKAVQGLHRKNTFSFQDQELTDDYESVPKPRTSALKVKPQTMDLAIFDFKSPSDFNDHIRARGQYHDVGDAVI